MEMNGDVLAAGDSDWTDWRKFDCCRIGGPFVDGLRARAKAALIAEFADARIPVIKDPRMCRTHALLGAGIRGSGVVDAGSPAFKVAARSRLVARAPRRDRSQPRLSVVVAARPGRGGGDPRHDSRRSRLVRLSQRPAGRARPSHGPHRPGLASLVRGWLGGRQRVHFGRLATLQSRCGSTESRSGDWRPSPRSPRWDARPSRRSREHPVPAPA